MSEYDTDILQWSEHQAELLRRRAAGDLTNEAALDWANIAEEIEDVGTSERNRLARRIGTVIEHLIKLSASPATDPRNGWRDTIRTARRDIDRTIAKSRTLRDSVSDIITKETEGAREDAAASLADYGENPLIDIAAVTFTEDQVLGPWLP
jgi:Domain of unknown function DUF29